MSDRGNYSLAIVKIKEDYDSISDALSDLASKMKLMCSVDYNGRQISIIYYLGEIGSFWLVFVVLVPQIQTLPVFGAPVQKTSVAIYQNGLCLIWLYVGVLST